MELMTVIWKSLDKIGRECLLDVIMAGPPQETGENKQEPEARHQHWQDGMVFERLMVIDSIHEPPLSSIAQSKLLALKLTYPDWTIEAVEKAGSLVSAKNDQSSKVDGGVEDLKSLSGAALRNALREPGRNRDHRLEFWSRIVQAYPDRGIDLLTSLVSDITEQDRDIWQETLYGLYGRPQETLKPVVFSQIADILSRMPSHLVQDFQLALQASEFLEIVSKLKSPLLQDTVFWHLWDRLVESTLADDDIFPPDYEWMSRAIHQPLGMLTTALLEMLIRSGTKTGEGFTSTFTDRLERLTQPNPVKLRLARLPSISSDRTLLT
jgi:hypothetical protein